MARKKTYSQWPAKPEIFDIQALGAQNKVPGWEMAGLMRAAKWAPGKQVTQDQFAQALAMFRDRRQGSGRI